MHNCLGCRGQPRLSEVPKWPPRITQSSLSRLHPQYPGQSSALTPCHMTSLWKDSTLQSPSCHPLSSSRPTVGQAYSGLVSRTGRNTNSPTSCSEGQEGQREMAERAPEEPQPGEGGWREGVHSLPRPSPLPASSHTASPHTASPHTAGLKCLRRQDLPIFQEEKQEATAAQHRCCTPNRWQKTRD